LAIVQLEITGRLVRGTHGVRWRRLLRAGVATAVIGTAMPADAAWFYEPRAIAVPDPDLAAIKIKRQSSKRKNAADAAASLKSKAPEKLPEGPLQVIISIKQQRLTLYANGQPIAHSPVSTGVPGHPTPMGVFSVIEKQIYHESNLYSSAPMPYMQRITWSGVAMHQGVVPGHPASHGCIRLPREFAQRMWRTTKVGARVIIAQDEPRIADIASPRLFAGKTSDSSAALPAPAEKIRLATSGAVSDEPLKGTIDENKRHETPVESAIDKMVSDGAAAADAYVAADDAVPGALDKAATTETAKDPMLKPGPISVFISRKAGMLYVRKGFSPVFEAPVTIAQGDTPLGTHVFTAFAKDGGALRWNVVSLPTEHLVKKGKYVNTVTAKGEKLRVQLAAPEHAQQPAGDPTAALERINIPAETLARINELMTPGASLIVSDLAQSLETGAGTDFILLTR
jgi:lipoprotein-anchoring transpeptidase ErfK/SrfK